MKHTDAISAQAATGASQSSRNNANAVELTSDPSRRAFFKTAAAFSLMISSNGLMAMGTGAPPQSGPGRTSGGAAAVPSFEPNAFLRISRDGRITVLSKHLEMGQGTYTGLATLVAEELDADWSQVQVEGAPADAKRYSNLLWGAQGTGGSTAIANAWEQMRKAGATARAMLIQAAATQWGVPADSLRTQRSVVSHPASGRKATYGELAQAASQVAVPSDVTLKTPAQFNLIGKSAPRRDSIVKTTGRAVFTQDIQLPGMLVAMVAHPPRFGATVRSVDDSAARAIKGVNQVVNLGNAVAVLAKDTWTARKGRDALQIEWDDSKAFKLSTPDITAKYQALAKIPGKPAANRGNADAELQSNVGLISATFDFPYLAHAAMEPMDCVIHRTENGCEVWNGEQLHTGDQYALAQVFGIAPDQVRINTLYAGGSFGRRASKDSDYIVETARIVKAAKATVPVKLVWTREDDTRAGYFRPQFHHRLDAKLSPNGEILAWRHRLVGQSIAGGSAFEGMMVKDGIDALSVEGASNLPYAIPNFRVELHTPTDIGVPVLWWRSVGSSHTAHSTEVFLDMIARQNRADPVAMRLKLLKDHPRHAAVLKLAAEKAAWDKPLKPGRSGERRGRGVAVHESFRSYVAQVAEVTVKPDGSFKVDRIVCAVDCGLAINPDVIRAQIEGSVGFALSSVLYGEITLKDGVVEQGNFDSYPVIRINEMPKVETHIVASAEAPTGIGEPGVPPVAPAIVNALAAATGKVPTSLPVKPVALKA